MNTLQLKLYITGISRSTELAIANLRKFLDKELNGEYELVVNDILRNPEIAEEQKILATPTIIKEFPLPVKRLIGDFSDAEKVLFYLDLQPHCPNAQGGGKDE